MVGVVPIDYDALGNQTDGARLQVMVAATVSAASSGKGGPVTYGSYVDEVVAFQTTVNNVVQRYYPHANHLYSVAALTDSTGAVVEKYSYTAYGKQAIAAPGGAARAKSSVGWDRGFTGYVTDNETGLLYARNRMYSPTLGVFIQREPFGQRVGWWFTGFSGAGWQFIVDLRYCQPRIGEKGPYTEGMNMYKGLVGMYQWIDPSGMQGGGPSIEVGLGLGSGGLAPSDGHSTAGHDLNPFGYDYNVPLGSNDSVYGGAGWVPGLGLHVGWEHRFVGWKTELVAETSTDYSASYCKYGVATQVRYHVTQIALFDWIPYIGGRGWNIDVVAGAGIYGYSGERPDPMVPAGNNGQVGGLPGGNAGVGLTFNW